MFELLAVPVAMATAALWPSKKEELKKIKSIFKAAEFGMKSKINKEAVLTIPEFRSKSPIINDKKVVGMEYWFALPLGMSEAKIKKFAEENILGVGLQKTVRVMFDDLLKVKVYDTKIPKLIHYSDAPKTKKWEIPIGIGFDRFVHHNFDHTPHMVVSGTTRFGKTVFLKVAMTRLIENNPDDVEFYVIDLKGGLEFGPYERLKQMKRVVANAEDAAVLLDGMLKEIQKEYDLFRANNWSNVIDTPIKKRKFIIVDEAAQLAPEKWMDKETKALLSFCQAKLCEIARIAGALGYRLIYCTQYPTADTVPRQIKQNADAKLSFRLSTSIASKVAIDVTGAEELPSDFKGRALYKTHEVKEIQVPLIDHKEMMDRLQSYIKPHIAAVPPVNVVEQPVKTENKGENNDEQTSTSEEKPPRNDLIQFRKIGVRD